MVIIDNPGSPTIVYTKDGITISAVASSGQSQGDTTITCPSGHTVVIVTCDTNNFAATLPSSPDIGQIVEAYCDASSGHDLNIFPGSGGVIGLAATNAEISIAPGDGVYIRYVGSSVWQVVGRYGT